MNLPLILVILQLVLAKDFQDKLSIFGVDIMSLQLDKVYLIFLGVLFDCVILDILVENVLVDFESIDDTFRYS